MFIIGGFLTVPQEWWAPLLPLEKITQGSSLQEWGTHLLESIPAQSIVIGYSLGGRILLHAVLQNPSHFRAAIFVSTHPGLKTAQEKRERLLADQNWAERFLHTPWNQVITAWNQQPVFQGSLSPPKKEADFLRSHLASLLTLGSLGTQQDFRSTIAQWPLPLLWLTGEKDTKFTALAKELSFAHPDSSQVILPQCGHRPHIDNPLIIQKVIFEWISCLGWNQGGHTPLSSPH